MAFFFQAVYDEIAVQRPDLVLAGNDQRRQQNYRHDQNIIVNNRRIPTIIVPNPGPAEYVTGLLKIFQELDISLHYYNIESTTSLFDSSFIR